MRVIGLTGSIACGKSTVSEYLSSQGFTVIDGDRLSRELMVPGSPVLSEVRSVFGSRVFNPDGSLNRRQLGSLVFRDPEARKALDDLMSPHLQSLTEQRLESVRRSGQPLCFLEMPLLFEKGYNRYCDTVWTVWLPQDIQLQRLMNRDGFTREEALQRMGAVMSSDEKAARANRVIDNSGTPDQTLETVSALLAEELRRNDAAPRPRRSRSQSPQSGIPPAAGDPSPAQPSPPAAPEPVGQPPVVMARPSAAARQPSERKVAWKLPVWIKTMLIVSSILLIIGITAVSLMMAYLHRQENLHISEQKAIDASYPLLYRELIERWAGEYNLSPAFVSAVILNESSFQPRVESGVGARGLMQLMPDTAEWIAHKLNVEGYAFDRMYDPESNIRFGCWYLNYLSRLFLGDPVSVTAAYHAGQGQVKVWLSDPARSEDGYTMPLESLPEGPTKKYAGRVTRDYGIYQEKYFAPALVDAAADADAL